MRVFISRGAGLVGSPLWGALWAGAHQVDFLDDLSSDRQGEIGKQAGNSSAGLVRVSTSEQAE